MAHVSALRMRFTSPEEAGRASTRYSGCPKVLFWGRSGAEAYIVLKVPEGGSFWSDYIRDNPRLTFGGLEARLVYMEEVHAPGSVEISCEKISGDVSPCGSVCRTCPSLGRCGGCPALSLE